MPRRASRGGLSSSSRLSKSTPRPRGRSVRSSRDDTSSSPDPLDVISDASDSRHSPRKKTRRATSSSCLGGDRISGRSRSVSVDSEQTSQGDSEDASKSVADVQEEDEWAVFREEGDRPFDTAGTGSTESSNGPTDTPNIATHPFRLSPRQDAAMLSPQQTESKASMAPEVVESAADTTGLEGADSDMEKTGIPSSALSARGQNEDDPVPAATAAVQAGAADQGVHLAEGVQEMRGYPEHVGDKQAEAGMSGPKMDQRQATATRTSGTLETVEPATPTPMLVGDEAVAAERQEIEGRNDMDERIQIGKSPGEDIPVEEAAKSALSREPDAVPIVDEPMPASMPKGNGANAVPTSTDIVPSSGVIPQNGHPADEHSEGHENDVVHETENFSVVNDQGGMEVTAADSDRLAGTSSMLEAGIPDNKVNDSPESTPLPTSPIKHEEEGEEELDDDDPLPGSEPSTTYVDDDVDMDAASATIAPSSLDQTAKPSPKKKSSTASKTKPKSTAKIAVNAAAKKASKQSKSKTKVDELKGTKSKASRGTPDSATGTSVSIASAEMARADSSDSTTDRVWCICRKRESEDDDDVMMVGCESCDNWFHPACVGLTDDQVENLDVYICRSCERSTKQKTIYKKSCKRDGCDKTLGSRESKYCSDLCAYKVMKAFAESISNKKTLKQISTAFTGYPKPPPVQIIQHANIEPAIPDARADQLIAAVQGQISVLSSALDIVRKRQEILRQAIEHAESLAPVQLPVEERSGKSKRKGGGGPTEDKQCAWDPRLIWTDEDVKRGAGEHVQQVCELAKRRCDKHSGWQKTIAISLEVEERQLERQHQSLVEQYEGLMKSAESTKESEHIRTVFRDRLTAKRRA